MAIQEYVEEVVSDIVAAAVDKVEEVLEPFLIRQCDDDGHPEPSAQDADGKDAVQPGQPGEGAVQPGDNAVQPAGGAVQSGEDAGQPGEDAVQPGEDAAQSGEDAGQSVEEQVLYNHCFALSSSHLHFPIWHSPTRGGEGALQSLLCTLCVSITLSNMA